MLLNFGNIAAAHGRMIYPGQIWRSNDSSRLAGVRVLGFTLEGPHRIGVAVEDIITKQAGVLPVRSFTVGPHGWSLEKENA